MGDWRRAASLTQRLLGFSRRQTFDPKPTDVNRLISGLQDMLQRTVGASADIEIVGAAGLWTTDIDAAQVADAARTLRPGLKVLFITGFAENAAVGNGHLEPGMELLTKPFTLETLSAKVADMLKVTII